MMEVVEVMEARVKATMETHSTVKTITGRTRLAGIMGWPVAHSRSPAMHNFWLEEQGIDGAYVPLPVRPQQLEQALRALPSCSGPAAPRARW
jgi:Shikimate dehydrogenase substrate binding domain